jgi:hypothetical protein
VRDIRHNATEEMSGTTFSQLGCRKGDGELCARLEAMEVARRRAPDAGDINDVEREEVELEEAAGENFTKSAC